MRPPTRAHLVALAALPAFSAAAAAEDQFDGNQQPEELHLPGIELLYAAYIDHRPCAARPAH